jgi:tetratricopeptide (TPR) repeat protein
LIDYGFSSDVNEPLNNKRDLLLELFNELPVLLIVDDLDSVQPENEDAVEFLTIDVGQTKTKVLFTSRRQFAGLGNTKTVVAGLGLTESLLFIETKGLAVDLSPKALTNSAMSEIFELCEGSPLYMEDLLRLAKAVGVDQAIQSWRNSGGDTVRRYALERERAMLTPLAQEMLDICALAGRPLTLAELAAVAHCREESVAGAVDELQRLHLVPAADDSNGESSFQVNTNLGLLVRGTPAFEDRWKRYENALKSVSGEEFSPSHRSTVRDSLRRANLQLAADSPIEAERTLQGALETCPEDPHLFGLLGVVYAKFKPQRAVDAREQWERAYALGSKDKRMYVNWVYLELHESKFDRARDAAMRGIERVKNDAELLELAGYASSELAKRYAASLNEDKAAKEFMRSDSLLSKAIRLRSAPGTKPRTISFAYFTYVRNAEARHEVDKTCRRLKQWLVWTPDNPYAKREALKRQSQCPDLLSLIEPGLGEEPV